MTKSLLMKQDRVKFDEAARRIRPRKGSGCLVFLTCSVPEMEKEIFAGLEDQLAGDFTVQRRAYGEGEALLGGLPAFEPEKPILFVFCDFPYVRFAAQSDDSHAWNRKLAEGLNVERDLIPNRQLHCVFILPQPVEDLMALVAADFYHFRTWSAHFRDDLAVMEKRLLQPKDPDLVKRIALLEKRVYQSRDFVHKANAHMELAQANMSAHDHQLAMEHLETAKKLYKRKKFEEGVANAFAKMAGLYMEQGKYRTAMPFAKRFYAFWKTRNNPEKLVLALSVMALLQSYCGQFLDELSLLEKTLKALSGSHDGDALKKKLIIQSGIGRIYFTLGQSGKAERQGQMILNSPDFPGLNDTEKASIYEQVGSVQTHLGEIDKAREYGKLAVGLSKENLDTMTAISILGGEWEAAENWLADRLSSENNKVSTPNLRQNLAWLSHKKMNYTKAKEQMAQVIELGNEIESERLSKGQRAFYADILRKTGDVAPAEELYLMLLESWGEGDMYAKAEAHQGLGFIYCDSDRLDLAREQAQAALAIAQKSSYRLIEGETLTLVARIQGREGHWQEAYENLKIAWEKVRDRDIPLEAQVLEQLGDAAQQIGNARAGVWHQKALTLYRNLELPPAEPLARRLEAETKS